MNDDQSVSSNPSRDDDSNAASESHPFPASSTTPVEAVLSVDAGPFVNIDPRNITVGRIVGLLGATVLSAVIASAVFGVWMEFGVDFPFWIAMGIGLSIITFLFVLFYIWPAWSYRCTTYRLNEMGLEIHHGVFWKHRTSVPVARVQHADVSQGPLQRKFELGKLTVHTAGTQNASVELNGIAHDVAVELRNQIVSQRKTSDVV